MPKKRTKEQKVRAQHHYTLPTGNVFSGNQTVTKLTAKNSSTDIESLYTYDPIFLRQDLRRTVIFSILIFALQIGLYFWLH